MTVKVTTAIRGTVPTQQYGNIQPEYVIERELPEGSSDQNISEIMRSDREIVEGMYQERDGKFREVLNAVQAKKS